MSNWHEVKQEDLSTSSDKDELHIWINSDYNGNNYAFVSLKILLKYLKKEGLIPRKSVDKSSKKLQKML